MRREWINKHCAVFHDPKRNAGIDTKNHSTRKSHVPYDPNHCRSSAGSGASPRILSASSSAIMIVGLQPWPRIIHAIIHSNLLNLTTDTVMYNVIAWPSFDIRLMIFLEYTAM